MLCRYRQTAAMSCNQPPMPRQRFYWCILPLSSNFRCLRLRYFLFGHLFDHSYLEQRDIATNLFRPTGVDAYF